MSVYGDYAKIEGKLDDLSEQLIDESKEMVAEKVKDDLIALGEDPESFYYESFCRQQYHNGDKDNPQFFDEPIFAENIPFVTVAVKAIPRET